MAKARGARQKIGAGASLLNCGLSKSRGFRGARASGNRRVKRAGEARASSTTSPSRLACMGTVRALSSAIGGERAKASPSGGELTEQLPVDPRHDLGQVLRNQPRTGRTPRLAMQPDRGRRRLESRHALSEATRRDARKDVARAGGGEPRRCIVGNRGAPVRSGNHGVRPLEENYGSARLRRPTGSLKLRGNFISQRLE